jgi:hypothetical protein
MSTNDFKPFASQVGANVTAQGTWEASATLATGFQTGTAISADANKAIRQASIIASMLAQFIVDHAAVNAVDDGTTATLEANLAAAIEALLDPRYAALHGSASDTFAAASPVVSDDVVPVGYGDARYAALTGNLSNTFEVATAVDPNDAVPLGQVNTLLSATPGILLKSTFLTASNPAFALQAGTTRLAVLVVGAGSAGATSYADGSGNGTAGLGGKAGAQMWGFSTAALSGTYAATVGTSGNPSSFTGTGISITGDAGRPQTYNSAIGPAPVSGGPGDTGIEAGGLGGVGAAAGGGGGLGAGGGGGGTDGFTTHAGGAGGGGVIYIFEYA